jgi:hypothetical protein
MMVDKEARLAEFRQACLDHGLLPPSDPQEEDTVSGISDDGTLLYAATWSSFITLAVQATDITYKTILEGPWIQCPSRS